jgi:hypothetical protein
MLKYGSFLWGCNTSASYEEGNLRPCGISTSLGHVAAGFFGMIVRHDKCLKRVVADVIEEEEMSLRWYAKDGIVLRYRMLGMKTEYRCSGGIAASLEEVGLKRRDKELKGIRKLEELFPGWVTVDMTKKSSKINIYVIQISHQNL